MFKIGKGTLHDHIRFAFKASTVALLLATPFAGALSCGDHAVTCHNELYGITVHAPRLDNRSEFRPPAIEDWTNHNPEGF
jgi:hypothetical protein